MSAHAAGARVPPTGSQFLLEGQGQRAVVTEVGATLRSWRVGEHEQLDTFPVDELDDDYRGKVLVPWPNRIRDARYVFRGTEYRTAISEPERGGALHGLVLWASWRPLRHSRATVTTDRSPAGRPHPAARARARRYSSTTISLSSSTVVSPVGLSNVISPSWIRFTRSQDSSTCT